MLAGSTLCTMISGYAVLGTVFMSVVSSQSVIDAVTENDAAALSTLLQNGADVDFRNDDGETLLM